MFAVALFCIACVAYWAWRQKNRKVTEPPFFPGGWPIVGHAPALIGDSCKLWDAVNDLARQSYDIGGVVSAAIGPRTVYIVTDPDASFTIANSCLEKDGFYDFAKPWLGEGLVTGKYSIWKNHRKLLNPAFSQILLDTFMGVFNSQSRKLVKDMEKEAGKGLFDHWTYTRHNALETICLTALGVDFTDSNLNSKYVEAAELIFNTIVERFTKFWWHSPYTFAWSNVKKKQDACLKILHNMSNTVLQKRKSEFNGNICAARSIIPGSKFKPFMDLLLDLSVEKGVFNDREIREHVDTMIVGGHDTSANVLMFTFILLGSHPEAQEKAFAEVREVLGDGDRDVEKADLSKLVYLEAVLKESMRVFTIVPVLARKLDKDVKLKNYTLSAGRTCFLFVFGLHKHPMWGPDVNEFKPERWLEPGKLPENPNAFAAFSVGRRQCIGKAYALMSMKTTLAHVVRHYKIKADHTKVRLKLDVMLKPDAGHCVSIERR
uniref:Cytochrome P450 n=1 Tax=Heliothis virescens TaxID=7102 RepID=A0A2A4JSD1_HELVI